MGSRNKLLRQIEAVEARRKPPARARGICLYWYPPEPCGPDEELVITHHEQWTDTTWFRIYDKRKKKTP